uniref:Uncharacterized protein n=1 Tax=Corethron hystrix TaxID=216773 RepID=A0A7S1B356_9STRA|mmetsp:Transcript_1000/g.1964  ORF Transcript_1000/g.1964 Transcript_1000/m.1964 type:complete len:816 (+) Transcript_1000:85-2532(+)
MEDLTSSSLLNFVSQSSNFSQHGENIAEDCRDYSVFFCTLIVGNDTLAKCIRDNNNLSVNTTEVLSLCPRTCGMCSNVTESTSIPTIENPPGPPVDPNVFLVEQPSLELGQIHPNAISLGAYSSLGVGAFILTLGFGMLVIFLREKRERRQNLPDFGPSSVMGVSSSFEGFRSDFPSPKSISPVTLPTSSSTSQDWQSTQDQRPQPTDVTAERYSSKNFANVKGPYNFGTDSLCSMPVIVSDEEMCAVQIKKNTVASGAAVLDEEKRVMSERQNAFLSSETMGKFIAGSLQDLRDLFLPPTPKDLSCNFPETEIGVNNASEITKRCFEEEVEKGVFQPSDNSATSENVFQVPENQEVKTSIDNNTKTPYATGDGHFEVEITEDSNDLLTDNALNLKVKEFKKFAIEMTSKEGCLTESTESLEIIKEEPKDNENINEISPVSQNLIPNDDKNEENSSENDNDNDDKLIAPVFCPKENKFVLCKIPATKMHDLKKLNKLEKKLLSEEIKSFSVLMKDEACQKSSREIPVLDSRFTSTISDNPSPLYTDEAPDMRDDEENGGENAPFSSREDVSIPKDHRQGSPQTTCRITLEEAITTERTRRTNKSQEIVASNERKALVDPSEKETPGLKPHFDGTAFSRKVSHGVKNLLGRRVGSPQKKLMKANMLKKNRSLHFTKHHQSLEYFDGSPVEKNTVFSRSRTANSPIFFQDETSECYNNIQKDFDDKSLYLKTPQYFADELEQKMITLEDLETESSKRRVREKKTPWPTDNQTLKNIASSNDLFLAKCDDRFPGNKSDDHPLYTVLFNDMRKSKAKNI